MVAALAGFLLYLGAGASALAAGPQERIRETLDAVSTVFRDPELQGPDREAQRRQRVQSVIADTFDFPAMARESLGPYWATLGAAQREEFVRAFGDFFQHSYTRLVLKFLGEREAVYGAESVEGERAAVETTLRSKAGEGLPVLYRLTSDGRRWAVLDVVVDGISLTQNFQRQFDRIIRRSSFDELLQRIRAASG